MPWLNNVISAITGKKYDIEDIKTRVNKNAAVSDAELDAYIDDVDKRISKMEKDLRNTYSKYGVTFNGFRSLDTACSALRDSIKDGKEAAYNNLLKLESSITAEQKRHLALLRIAMTSTGKNVLDEINRDPVSKEIYDRVFGTRDAAGKVSMDGLYQRLWSEIHKLSEYIITQKTKVYH